MSSDPAINAAEKAIAAVTEDKRLFLDDWDIVTDTANAAAREALEPLNQLHRPVDSDEWHTSPDDRYCATCREDDRPTLWPCDTAKLIYPAEELR